MSRRCLQALLLAAALALSACGAAKEDKAPNQAATLLLDFQPNAVHTGIYTAVARGYDDALGVNLDIRVPSDSTDAVKLLVARRARLAILDIHDLAIARERGRDLVGVMAIVQQPLAAILALPSVKTPRDLEGRRVGVTGLPSDDAVLRSIVSGSGGDASRTRPTTIGFNAVHTGIYTAVARGYDTALGVTLRVRVPGDSTDAVKLLVAGTADLAVLDIHDLALARERGRDLVGVMALVQTPLAAVLASPQIRSPRELEGRRVGVTGLPSDDAVLRSIVKGAGGDPRKVDSTTIGFTAVRSVLTGRVAAATGFWNAEGVALRARRPQIREFRVDDFGAPAYPELVLAVTRETLQDRPAVVRATVAALARGYEEVLSDPENGVSALVEAVDGLDRAQVGRELDAVSPSFTAGARGFGELNRPRLDEWARWEKRFGITEREPEVGLAFDGRYVPAPGRD